MLTVYRLDASRHLVGVPVRTLAELDESALWVDMESPTAEERAWVEERYGRTMPALDSLVEIEASARFFHDGEGVHFRSYSLQGDTVLRNTTVAFSLVGGRLFTLHGEHLREFHHFAVRARNTPMGADSAPAILLELQDTEVGLLADELERLYAELEARSGQDYLPKGESMTTLFTTLSRVEDVNAQVRLSLMDNQRALSFLARSGVLEHPGQIATLHEILRDIESLLSHSNFLVERIQLMMSAAMGIVNIQQNQIIKLFSVMAVVLMPPTLIASIYGMNFHHMPELDTVWGYPLALSAMLVSAVAPYLFFKRKKWL